ncbi:MAG: hypothetical protein Ct9H90mP16_17630 [Candidatus Poseidoniales archaeon]|nr:MAG: hypothetical protein Ct9H90mP16_17630 [Candidatus Poseidoniales archaeon]
MVCFLLYGGLPFLSYQIRIRLRPMHLQFAGVPLLITGILATKIPEKRKLWMHIAATFGLICVIGGTRFFMVMSDGINYASGSMLMLFVTGLIYTYFCVQSFIWARKQREAAEA